MIDNVSNPEDQAAKALQRGNLSSLAQALRRWHDMDSIALAQWLDLQRSNSETSEILVNALVRGGQHEVALEHALALPDADRAICLRAVFSIMAATAPLDAWAVADGLRPTDLVESARDAILETGSDAALPQLADLALSHMESSGRAGPMQNILSRWVLQNPAEAAAWINHQSMPATIRDEVARHLVFQCDAENRPPETAIAWAESISEPAQRYQALAAASRELASTEPVMADKAIRNSQVLTETEKQSLLAKLASPPDAPDFHPAD